MKAVKKKVSKWNSTGGSNYVLQKKNWYISYNPCPGGIISSFRSDTGGAETAICTKGEFYILNGDFRKQYEKVKSLKEAMAIFKKNIKKRSSWSN